MANTVIDIFIFYRIQEKIKIKKSYYYYSYTKKKKIILLLIKCTSISFII